MKLPAVLLVLLSGCAVQPNSPVAKYVQLGCDVDNSFVPVSQNAADVIGPAIGTLNVVAGTIVIVANEVDRVLVHPAVVAFCQAELGNAALPAAKALPAGVVVSTINPGTSERKPSL